MHEVSSRPDCDNVSPIPLCHSHVSLMCSLPSFSLEYCFDVPIDNFMKCDSNTELGHKDNMFNMLSGSVANFLFQGYFSGYDASLDPYCIYLVDKSKKIMWNTFIDFSFDFSMAFALSKRALTLFATIILVLLLPSL